MTVIPMCTMLYYRKLVKMCSTRFDRHLCKVRYTVFFVGQKQTMPMQRSCFFQFVMYIYFCCISFGERQCRHRNLSVYGNSSFGFTCKIYNGISYIQIVTDSTGWSVIDNRFGKTCFIHSSIIISIHFFRHY